MPRNLAVGASAEEYLSLDYETVQETTGRTSADAPDDMSVAQNANAAINHYFKFANSSGGGTQTAYYTFDSTAQTVEEKKSVLEFDFYMVNDGSDDTYTAECGGSAWVHAKAVMDFSSFAVTLSLLSLDGETVYFDNRIPMGSSTTSAIPLDESSVSEAQYSAAVIDGDGVDLQRTATLEVYDKTGVCKRFTFWT